jgi:anti-sigma regulatory factor (Ser/Thr protein kinase)
MPTASLTLCIKNSLEEIPRATQEVSSYLADQQVSSDAIFFASLAIEELSSNCVKYGFDDSEEHLITISVSIGNGVMELTVIDDGHAFNPLTFPEPDTDIPAQERPIGGLGLHLVRKMADHATYSRLSEQNRLTLKKSL